MTLFPQESKPNNKDSAGPESCREERRELRLAVYGASGGGKLFAEALDGSRHEVTVFLDRDPAKQGTTIRGIPVVAPERLAEHCYDKVVIASVPIYEEAIYETLMELGVPPDSVVPGSLLRFGAQAILDSYSMEHNIDICVSGLSYHKHGVLGKFSKYNVFNYAQNSLDLYYDFQMANAFLSAGSKPITAWLIGLSQYIFHYDMSLSKMWRSVFYYKDMFGYHNLSAERRNLYLDAYESKRVAHLFSKQTVSRIRELDYNWAVYERNDVVNASELTSQARSQAQVDFNKSYPKTVAENVAILERYIKLLQLNHITPILTVVPMLDSYKLNSRLKVVTEFNAILDELMARHDCIVINGYNLDGYTLEHFRDPIHMNVHGGKKFTAHVDAVLSELFHVGARSLCA